MEDVVAIGGPVLLLLAACIVSWVLGDLNGARRMQLLVGASEPRFRTGAAPQRRTLDIDLVEHPAGSRRRAPSLPVSAPPSGWRLFAKDGRSDPARSRFRREALSSMPTLAELQEEANAIRSESRIWDDPELCSELRSASRHAGRILGHYERSISTLQQVKGTPDIERAATGPRFDMMEIAELPRFSDAAPYSPCEASRSAPLRNAAG